MKAFTVQEPYEGFAIVVFAKHGVVARRQGANEFDIDFEDIESCRRAPGLDKYAPGPVPTETLVMDCGWWQTCGYCEAMVTADNAHPFFVGQTAYCSPWHYLRMAEARAKYRAERKRRAAASVSEGEAKE